jgi:hypothetical protein
MINQNVDFFFFFIIFNNMKLLIIEKEIKINPYFQKLLNNDKDTYYELVFKDTNILIFKKEIENNKILFYGYYFINTKNKYNVYSHEKVNSIKSALENKYRYSHLTNKNEPIFSNLRAHYEESLSNCEMLFVSNVKRDIKENFEEAKNIVIKNLKQLYFDFMDINRKI